MNCPCGTALPSSSTIRRQYCANCLEYRRKESQNRKNRRARTILSFKRIRVSLKNNSKILLKQR